MRACTLIQDIDLESVFVLYAICYSLLRGWPRQHFLRINRAPEQSNCELAHNVSVGADAIMVPLRLPTVFGPAVYAIETLMKTPLFAIGPFACLLLAACSEEVPPVSVSEFADNPRLLEATMLRCAANRSETRYDQECINAREAVNRIEAAEERVRRVQMEEQSERKRQALRRTQEAAAAARQRALEEQRRREEEQYLGMFEDALSGTNDGSENPPPPIQAPPIDDAPGNESPSPVTPVEETAVEESAAPSDTDLNAIREELKRRQENPPD